MAEVKSNIKEPVEEDKDSVIKRLEEENKQLRQLAQRAIDEASAYKAIVKAMSTLL